MHVMSCIFLFVRFATSVVYSPNPHDFHFSVAVVLLRMMVAVIDFVEYGVEYVMEYIVGYLASRWLLSVHVMVAFWLLSGCLLFAVAVMLRRILSAAAFIVEDVVEYGVEHYGEHDVEYIVEYAVESSRAGTIGRVAV
jgi:hypothetical protein